MLINVLLVVIAVVLFGLIIFIHELGHFITAKLSGIRVNEFSIGMGPTLFHFGKGETKYSLRLLPIGGFCAMEGEDEHSDDTHAFSNKPVWKRMLVVVMGAVMNVILGIILMMIILGQRQAFNSTTIAEFSENAATQSAGLKVNDQFFSINGYRIYTDGDISFALATADPKSIDVQVIRDGKKLTFDNIKLNSTESNGKKIVSLDFKVFPISKNIGSLISKSLNDTVSVVRMVWGSLVGLVSGKFGFNDIAGPVGTATVISQAASIGLKVNFLAAFNNILYVMMIITVNLGVVNLLPLPALDGGRFVLLIIEGIRRKPLNPKYEGWINAAGFALLMVLMVVVTLSDVLRLITGKGLGG